MNARIRKKKLKLYAKKFCNEVRRTNTEWTTKNPIIKCYREKGLADDIPTASDFIKGSIETYNGSYIIDGEHVKKTGTVIIYNIFGETMKALKKTIRHECLHFMLYESGKPSNDNDEAFLIMATLYNASPYGLF